MMKSLILISLILTSNLYSEKSIEEIAENREQKSLLLIFTADWDGSGHILDSYLKHQSTNEKFSEKLEILKVDCTNPKGNGFKQMKRFGELATPISAMIVHSNGVRSFIKLDLTNIDTFHTSILKLQNTIKE